MSCENIEYQQSFSSFSKGSFFFGPPCTRGKCVGGRCAGSMDEKEVVLQDGSNLECVNKFCYLEDMLGAAGGCGEASTTRVRGSGASSRSLPRC